MLRGIRKSIIVLAVSAGIIVGLAAACNAIGGSLDNSGNQPATRSYQPAKSSYTDPDDASIYVGITSRTDCNEFVRSRDWRNLPDRDIAFRACNTFKNPR